MGIPPNDRRVANEGTGEPGTCEAGDVRRETLGLGVLFGTIYFIQGIGEPTEGLIAQPVRSLLKTWGHSAEEIATFAALLAVPWSLKPLYGLLTDFVPLAGYRRKSYLIVTSIVTTVGLVGLYLFPLSPGSWHWLLLWLLLPTVAVAFSDVVADALMIEKGQPRGLTGQLQSVQWAAMYGATILTGIAGGYLSEHHAERLGFLLCAGGGGRHAGPLRRLRARAASWRSARELPRCRACLLAGRSVIGCPGGRRIPVSLELQPLLDDRFLPAHDRGAWVQ
jgi:BT1 family.